MEKNEMIVSVIKKKIEERGMMQKVVAERVNMDSRAFSAVLCGQRRLMGSELIDICALLGLTLDDFKAAQAV